MSETSRPVNDEAAAGASVQPLTAADLQFARELADPNFSLSVPAAAKTMLTRLLAVAETNQAREAEVARALDLSLFYDGSHHKQWGLERIADAFGIEHDNVGIAP